MPAISLFLSPEQQSLNHQKEIAALLPYLYENKPTLSCGEFIEVTTKVCKLPAFLNSAFFYRIHDFTHSGTLTPEVEKEKTISMAEFKRYWSDFCAKGFRVPRMNWNEALMYDVLKQSDSIFISDENLLLVINDILEYHPSLKHRLYDERIREYYAITIMTRIYFAANRLRGQLTWADLKRTDVISNLQRLHKMKLTDIKCENPFSFSQFYVIYRIFRDIDRDNDDYINESDLVIHNDYHWRRTYMLNMLGIRRVATGRLAKLSACEARQTNCMNYIDFIWFSLAEIEKTSSAAIEFWFRCLDIDDDGVLSAHELSQFWKSQDMYHRVRRFEPLENLVHFDEVMTIMNDLVRPEKENQFTLKDFKRCNKESFYRIRMDVPINSYVRPIFNSWDNYVKYVFRLISETEFQQIYTTDSEDSMTDSDEEIQVF